MHSYLFSRPLSQNFVLTIEDEKRYAWEENNVEVMQYLLESKAEQCLEFKNCLLENKGKILAEATMSMIWGTGLSPYVSTHTAPYYWPGKNQLGALLIDLTQKLFPDEAMDHDEHSRAEQTDEGEDDDEEGEEAFEDAYQEGEENEHDEGTSQDGVMNQEEGVHSEQIDHRNTNETAPPSTTMPEKSIQTTTGSPKAILTSSTVNHGANGYTEKPYANSSQRQSVKKTSLSERTPRTAIRKGKLVGGNAVKKTGSQSKTPKQQDIKTALTTKRKNPSSSPQDNKDTTQAPKQIKKDNNG